MFIGYSTAGGGGGGAADVGGGGLPPRHGRGKTGWAWVRYGMINRILAYNNKRYLFCNSAIGFMEIGRNCEIFKKFYYHLYERINFEFTEETGDKIKEYKPYEPDLLITYCEMYQDQSVMLNQISKLLSGLIILQALPNANHRSSFRFVDLYFGFACGSKMATYKEEKELYDGFYVHSKQIIDFEINHEQLFNEHYHDVHHTEGIKNHLKYSKELVEKIISTQSGIIEAVPFQRFITSLYQEGSSLNQTGSF